MKRRYQVNFVANTEQRSHKDSVEKLLRGAIQLECMIAFAKLSGLDMLTKTLISRLKSGLKARFAIGLDFFQTDPDLLWKLFRLKTRYQVSLYLSNSERTFHPKLYASTHAGGCSVLVGSANLTSGGMKINHESSALIEDPSGAIAQEVAARIDDLIEREELVEASEDRIREYCRQHRLYHALRKINEARFNRAKDTSGINLEILRSSLLDMKNDRSENGFRAQKILRQRSLTQARVKIAELASTAKLNSSTFIELYEQLLDCFHSGGLHRGKRVIARKAERFKEALVGIQQLQHPSAERAFQLLIDHFESISRAGINVLTEILLAFDSKRFAVMNQNSVAGLFLANIDFFPAKPNKSNVDAELYARYCQLAAQIRDDLGLANFAELDALFNYAYWKER